MEVQILSGILNYRSVVQLARTPAFDAGNWDSSSYTPVEHAIVVELVYARDFIPFVSFLFDNVL